ncbi:MAG TPA: DUF4340 domain-containing protein [Rhizomicrobium sp.]
MKAGSPNEFFADPRRRNLSILAGVAVLTIVLALLALWGQAGEMAPHYKPHTFFPQLPSEVSAISSIRIQSKKGTVVVAFKPEKGWVVDSQGDYPASFEELRQTIIGMAELQTIEPKTARADWLHYVGLDAPPKGAGVLISLLNEKGAPLASMIAGKSEDIGDPGGAVGLYVRKPDSAQSWLVRSVFEPKSDPADWLDKQVLDIDRARIQEADVEPADGPSYEVRRKTATDEQFALVNPPKGREIAYPGAADGVAAATVGFTFDAVRPARDFDFSDQAHAARLMTRTFDGLTVTAETIRQGHDYWTILAADGAPGKPEAQKEAREISAHVSGWAYKLPQYKGQLFMTSLDSLLKPLPAAPQGKPAR